MYHNHFLLLNSLLPKRIKMNIIRTIIIATTIKGVKSDKTDVPKAAACSPVATIVFPVPAVNFEDASLVRAVPP